MSDWDAFIRGLEGAQPPAPVEHCLWLLRKGTRTVEARVVPHPLGQELRLSVDGELLWSEVFRPGRGVVLGEIAEAKRREFESRGWQARLRET